MTYQPTMFLRIDFDAAARLGPGKIRLLELIRETGSISAAGRGMNGMSYRRAWLLIETMNAMFSEQLVATKLGGKGGGGAELTPLGAELIEAYRRYEAEVTLLSRKYFDRFSRLQPSTPAPS